MRPRAGWHDSWLFFFLILLSVSSFGGRPSDSSADGGGGGGSSGEAGRRNSACELPSADFGEKRQKTFFLVTMNTNAFHLLLCLYFGEPWTPTSAQHSARARERAGEEEKEESQHLSLFNHRSSRSKLTFYTNYRIQQTKITYSFSKSSGGERERARSPSPPNGSYSTAMRAMKKKMIRGEDGPTPSTPSASSGSSPAQSPPPSARPPGPFSGTPR